MVQGFKMAARPRTVARVSAARAGGARPLLRRGEGERKARMCPPCPATATTADNGKLKIVEDLQKTRLITALKTPYLENGRFDLRAYDKFLEKQIENGVEGVIVGGTTGEGQLMSWDEHIMLIAHTVNVFGRDIMVIGNTGSNSTREAMHATEQGFNVGMHASLQINPYVTCCSLLYPTLLSLLHSTKDVAEQKCAERRALRTEKNTTKQKD